MWLLVVCLASGFGCKSTETPVVNTPAPPPAVPLDTRVAWILRLEQQRTLRDPGVTPSAGATPPAPARSADLIALLTDTDARVRRRAALAIGRVGDAGGAAPLAAALGDQEEDVRATAAFALGVIGAKSGVEPLETALKDASPQVRGRAADALGLIGDPAAADAIAGAAAGCPAVLAPMTPDDEALPKDGEIEFCRLAIDALARLKQYDALAKIVLDQNGGPVSRWWPVA